MAAAAAAMTAQGEGEGEMPSAPLRSGQLGAGRPPLPQWSDTHQQRAGGCATKTTTSATGPTRG